MVRPVALVVEHRGRPPMPAARRGNMSVRFRDVMMEARIRRYMANDPKPPLFRCWVRAFVGRFKWKGSRPRVASPVARF
jgi:hypothetical protein